MARALRQRAFPANSNRVNRVGPLFSVAVVALAGAFLIALGAAALFRPPTVKRFLLGFASSCAVHYLELGIRLLVGAAFICAAPSMVGTTIASWAGWILLGTTGALFLMPWRVHRALAQRTVPQALAYLPVLGMVSLIAGAFILWAAFSAVPALTAQNLGLNAPSRRQAALPGQRSIFDSSVPQAR